MLMTEKKIQPVPLLGLHGGSCCGYNHIWNFYPVPYQPNGSKERQDFFDAEIKRVKEYISGCTFEDEWDGDDYDDEYYEQTRWEGAMILEIILTDYQLCPERIEWLGELGFKEVNTWLNPNSGNLCHQYTRNPYVK